MPKRKSWSKLVEESGIQVRLYTRPNSTAIYREVRLDGRKDRKSLGYSDRELAEKQARVLARHLAEARLTGASPADVTLGQVLSAYRRHKLPTLRGAHRKAVDTRLDLFERAWGSELRVEDFSQTHVDRYAVARMDGSLSPLEGRTGRGARKPRAVRAGAVDAELRILSSIFNFAVRHKRNGRRLIQENPLRDVKRPAEKNVRRPVASHERYTRTQEHADAVDPAGRLRCILALARYTGRRESAICGLQACDLLLSEERVGAALAAAGLNEATRDQDGAELYPYGAIHWSPELDKMKLVHVTPITVEARAELDRYVRKSARVGDVPLFPAPESPEKPLRRDVAARWLLKAERAAELPKLVGGVFHPYRRLWATERQHLSDVAVAAAGGWSDTQALKKSYQRARPVDILRAVNG